MRRMTACAAGSLLFLFVLLACAGGAAAPADGDGKWERLFDGRTLAGWKGDTTIFTVEDGAIVGRAPAPRLKKNQFLGTEREYSDFVLRLKFKMLDGKGNSGVQFRSEWNGGVVKGYQADLGKGWWGKLYDEHMRRKVLAGPPKDLVQRVVKPADWNTYEISAIGADVELKINGETTAKFTDTEKREKGIIALQVHSGPPMEIRFKDIEILVK
jgi:hypothetical protein